MLKIAILFMEQEPSLTQHLNGEAKHEPVNKHFHI